MHTVPLLDRILSRQLRRILSGDATVPGPALVKCRHHSYLFKLKIPGKEAAYARKGLSKGRDPGKEGPHERNGRSFPKQCRREEGSEERKGPRRGRAPRKEGPLERKGEGKGRAPGGVATKEGYRKYLAAHPSLLQENCRRVCVRSLQRERTPQPRFRSKSMLHPSPRMPP